MVAVRGGVVSLVAVLAFGVVGGGARSWLQMGPVQLQPSELVKLVVVLVLAAYLSRNAAGNPRVFIGSLGLVALPALLVAAQPDLGTALVFGAIFVMLMFTGGLGSGRCSGSGLSVPAEPTWP